jgi:hypothetical protein
MPIACGDVVALAGDSLSAGQSGIAAGDCHWLLTSCASSSGSNSLKLPYPRPNSTPAGRPGLGEACTARPPYGPRPRERRGCQIP